MNERTARIRVWDLPVRIFHWALVGAFAGAYLLAESERQRQIHVMLGYTVLGLVAFVRGRGNLWLARGAGASTALAASVAGAVVEPAIALLVGGLATMAVSWVALRSARDS